MRTSTRLLRPAFLAMMIWASAVVPAVAGEIVIEASALGPPVLPAVVGERVTFVNHSGLPVHVDFGVDPDRHHVFQVADRIWAVFHRTGPHPYAVHLTDGGVRELHGAVEVSERARDASLPECPGFVIVMGACVDP